MVWPMVWPSWHWLGLVFVWPGLARPGPNWSILRKELNHPAKIRPVDAYLQIPPAWPGRPEPVGAAGPRASWGKITFSIGGSSAGSRALEDCTSSDFPDPVQTLLFLPGSVRSVRVGGAGPVRSGGRSPSMLCATSSSAVYYLSTRRHAAPPIKRGGVAETPRPPRSVGPDWTTLRPWKRQECESPT